MANDSIQKSNYLLVTLNKFDDQLVQQIFEIALKFKLPPISFNKAKDEFIFEVRDNLADQFKQELLLEDIPVTTEMIHYTF